MGKDSKNHMQNLSVNLAGVKLRTPVGVGPIGSPPVRREQLTMDVYAEIFFKHIHAGAGFICLPHTIHVPDSLLRDLEKRARPLPARKNLPRPMIFFKTDERASMNSLPPGGGTVQGAAGAFLHTTAGLIKKLRENKPKDIPLIANVGGLGFFVETFVAGAMAHEEAGVDLIELNLATPASAQTELDQCVEGYLERDFPLYPPGLFLGDEFNLVERVVREVSRAVSIPVGIKISPETGFPRVIELARRIRDSGGKFITCSNMAITATAPDIYCKGKTVWPHLDGSPLAAIGGDWLRPITYKQIACIARFVPGIDIIGCGGISKPEHVVESIMLGAKAVEMVSPILFQGRKLLGRDVSFLESYMSDQGYSSVDEFRGIGLKHIKPANELHFIHEGKQLFAQVDPAKCKGCGICADSICLAISMKNGLAKVNNELCIACGMCVAVCPSKAVVIVVKEKDGS